MGLAKKVDGVWKDIQNVSVNVSGVWKAVTEVWINVQGVWKRMFSKIPTDLIAFSITSEDSGIKDWKRVDGSGVPLNLMDTYFRINYEEGITGGSLTHNHAAYVGSSGSLTNNLGGTHPDDEHTSGAAHTHTINHTHVADENNEPEYLRVLPLTEGTSVLNTMFLFFDGVTIPIRWSIYEPAIDRFLKGNLLPQVNSTGGAETHSHVYSGSSGSTDPGNVTCRDSATLSTTYLAHTHTINHTHSGGQNEPEWYSLIPIYPDGNTTIIPSGVCAFFKGGIVPNGWSYFSEAEGRFIKCKSVSGDTGGANEHNHVYTGSSGGGATGPGTYSGTYTSSYHVHTINHTHSTVENIPPYQELMLLKKD